jgi:hypothetical protein
MSVPSVDLTREYNEDGCAYGEDLMDVSMATHFGAMRICVTCHSDAHNPIINSAALEPGDANPHPEEDNHHGDW